MKDESAQKEGKYTESSLANQGGKKSNKRFILGRLFRYQNASSALQPDPRQLKSHPPQLLFSVVTTFFFSCPGTKARSLDTTAHVTSICSQAAWFLWPIFMLCCVSGWWILPYVYVKHWSLTYLYKQNSLLQAHFLSKNAQGKLSFVVPFCF